MERHIVHLRVPAFAVAVARVRDPGLRDRPLAVAAGLSDRALLLQVSAEARAEGARPGLTLAAARRLCPRLVVLPPDTDLLPRARAALLRLAGRYSPLVEPCGDGRLDIDLTGTTRLFGSARDTARRLRLEVTTALRLPARLGLSINRLVSGLAARVAPADGLADVRPGDEAPFLSPLSAFLLPAVRPIPEGRLLADLNLRRVSALVPLSLEQLVLAFHDRGYALYRQARGVDDSPVRPPARRPEIHVEETLAEDSNDDAVLTTVLTRLSERAGRRLRERGLDAGAALVAVRYADDRTSARPVRLAPGDGGDAPLIARLRALLPEVVARRTRVRRLALTLTRLTPADRQRSLFAPPGGAAAGASATAGSAPLTGALDRIRARHGEATVARLADLRPNAPPGPRVL